MPHHQDQQCKQSCWKPNPEQFILKESGHTVSKTDNHSDASQESCEDGGVRESPVPPEITVWDAQAKSNDIKIGNGRTCSSNCPNTLWHTRAVEARSDTKCSHGMGERRCHLEILSVTLRQDNGRVTPWLSGADEFSPDGKSVTC